MEKESYFNHALSNFTAEFAYAGAIRHLHDLGYSPEDIVRRMDFPVSEKTVRKVIEDYETRKNSPESEYIFVQETDRLGRRSFRKVKRGT